MKQIFVILAAFLFSAALWAQSPEKISYQAVIRNSTNTLVTNTQIGMEINIHQGSAAGTIVYTETLTPTTNANGLVSIEIGGTTGFDTIDWANGPYFMETKTATTPPLTTYTITGTTQLLSVPYALHAKTADNGFSGNYNDLTNKPTLFSGSYNDLTNQPALFSGDYNDLSNKPALFSGNYNDLTNKPTLFDGNYDSLWNKPNIRDTVTMYGFSGNYNDLTNKPTTDGSETIITAGTNVTISGSGTTANPYIVNSANTHYVGELYGGGIVFWVSPDGLHGLVMSLDDLSSAIAWSNITSVAVGNANDMYDGLSNSYAIVAQSGHTTSAAQLCLDYSYGGYNDWYLPASWQISQIYHNAYTLNYVMVNDGNPATVPLVTNQNNSNPPYPYYWSSTEYDNGAAWSQYFDGGSTSGGSKADTFRVRAVRAF